MASPYSDLERNADFAFYFSSPHLGSVAPRLPNTANTAFIQCRQVIHPSGRDLTLYEKAITIIQSNLLMVKSGYQKYRFIQCTWQKLKIFIARQVIALKSRSQCFCRQGRKLTEDLYSWLGRSNKSVVYISMGSIIRSEHLPDKHLQTFEKVRSIILFLTTCPVALLAVFAKVWETKQQKTDWCAGFCRPGLKGDLEAKRGIHRTNIYGRVGSHSYQIELSD